MRRGQHQVQPQDAVPAAPKELTVLKLDPMDDAAALYKRIHTHKQPLACELRLELSVPRLYITHKTAGDSTTLANFGGLLSWPIPILTVDAANWLLDEATAFAKGILEEIKRNGFTWTFNLQADLMVAEIRKLCDGPWRQDQVVRLP